MMIVSGDLVARVTDRMALNPGIGLIMIQELA
jgi:hypothetical protein